MTEALLYMVANARGALDPSTTLDRFAEAWLDDANKRHMTFYARNSCPVTDVALCHLEALL
jgi:hypothetical protein